MQYNPGMADIPAEGSTDPQWPRLLSLSAHEFRSPLTVVAGYIRMLLQERAGPLGEQQRRLLEEAERSCARLSQLLAELSELSQLESGTAPFNRGTVQVQSMLAEAIASLPDLPGRTAFIDLTADSALTVQGDASRLRTALASVLVALRRELVTGDRLAVRVDPVDQNALRIAIGEPQRLDQLQRLDHASLAAFDEWRGGNGLSLPNARRVIEAHGGRLRRPAGDVEGDRASAVIILPRTG
jgi:signal transduction histidine kinase